MKREDGILIEGDADDEWRLHGDRVVRWLILEGRDGWQQGNSLSAAKLRGVLSQQAEARARPLQGEALLVEALEAIKSSACPDPYAVTDPAATVSALWDLANDALADYRTSKPTPTAVCVPIKRGTSPCCEAMGRLDAIEGDATSLVGWSCPLHGVTLCDPAQTAVPPDYPGFCLMCGGDKGTLRFVCKKCEGEDDSIWGPLCDAWERGHGRPPFKRYAHAVSAPTPTREAVTARRADAGTLPSQPDTPKPGRTPEKCAHCEGVPQWTNDAGETVTCYWCQPAAPAATQIPAEQRECPECHGDGTVFDGEAIPGGIVLFADPVPCPTCKPAPSALGQVRLGMEQKSDPVRPPTAESGPCLGSGYVFARFDSEGKEHFKRCPGCPACAATEGGPKP